MAPLVAWPSNLSEPVLTVAGTLHANASRRNGRSPSISVASLKMLNNGEVRRAQQTRTARGAV